MNKEDLPTTKSEVKTTKRIRQDTNNEFSTKLPGIKQSNNTKQIDEETAQNHRKLILNQSVTTDMNRNGDLRGFTPQKRGSFLNAHVAPLDDMIIQDKEESNKIPAPITPN